MDWSNIIIAIVIFLAVAVVMGLVCAIGSHYFQVKVDERETEVTKLLPGYNCGACGKPGCSGFAAALVKGEAKSVDGCKVAKPEQKEAIRQYLAETPGPDGTTLKV